MERAYTGTSKLSRVEIITFIFFITYGFVLWGLTQGFRFTDSLINSADVGFYLWCFKWWGFAITNGINPFYTDLLFAPYGLNLTWTTCLPLFSLFSLHANDVKDYVFIYNGIVSLNLGLSGFLFYLTLKEFNIPAKISLLSSVVFVLSPYIWAKNHGHLNLLFVVFVISMLYTVILKVKGKLSDKGYIILMSVLMVCQFLVSVEMMFSIVYIGSLITAIAMVIYRDRISNIIRLSILTLVAGFLSIVILFPYLYAMLSDMPEYKFSDNKVYGIDVLSVVFPSADKLLHTSYSSEIVLKTSIGGNTPEQTGYLGIPLVVIIILYGLKVIRLKQKNGIFLVTVLILTTLLGLGAIIRFGGVDILPGVFRLFSSLPFFEHMLPNRLFLFVDILICIILAYYLKDFKLNKGVAVFSMVAISWLPDIRQYKGEDIKFILPEKSNIEAIKQHINKGDNVIIFPSYNMNSPEPALFQIATDFWFRLSQIVAGIYPSQIVRYTGFLTDPKYDDFYLLSDFLRYIQLCNVKWIIVHRQEGILREKIQQLESWFDLYFPKIEISDDLVIYRVDEKSEEFSKLKRLSGDMAVKLITDYKLSVERYIKHNDLKDVINAKRLIEAGYIKDKEPNPSDPNFTSDYYWIGELECDRGVKCYGIGLNINFNEEAKYIYSKFKDEAMAVLIPFPKLYTGQEIRIDDKVFGVVMFKYGE